MKLATLLLSISLVALALTSQAQTKTALSALPIATAAAPEDAVLLNVKSGNGFVTKTITAGALLGPTSNELATVKQATDTSTGLELARKLQTKLSSTNLVKVLIFGDSIGSWDMGGPGTGVHYWLGKLYGNAGAAGRSVNVFGTGLELYCQSVGASPAVVNQEAGTNWWSMWHTGTNGTTIQFSTENGYGYHNKAGLYWICHPQGGSFALQLSTNGGAFATVATCNSYAATRTAAMTNFALPRGHYKIRAVTSTECTNIIIAAQLYDDSQGGVMAWYVFKGGANFTHWSRVPQTVWDCVITNYNPDLIMYNMLEVPDIGTVQTEYHLTNTFAPWVAQATNAVVWLAGEAYRGDTNDYMHAQENEILRRVALAKGWVFTDTRFDAQSWSRSVALGYMRNAANPEDIVHFSPEGGRAFGWAALRRTGLIGVAKTAASTTSTSAVTNSQDSVQVGRIGVGSTNTLGGIFFSDGGGTQLLRIKSPGSGYMALYMGTNSAQADWGGYSLLGDNISTSLNVRNATGAMVSMRIGNTWVAGSTNVNEFLVHQKINALQGYMVGTSAGISTNIFVLTNSTTGVILNFTKGILTGVTPP